MHFKIGVVSVDGMRGHDVKVLTVSELAPLLRSVVPCWCCEPEATRPKHINTRHYKVNIFLWILHHIEVKMHWINSQNKSYLNTPWCNVWSNNSHCIFLWTVLTHTALSHDVESAATHHNIFPWMQPTCNLEHFWYKTPIRDHTEVATPHPPSLWMSPTYNLKQFNTSHSFVRCYRSSSPPPIIPWGPANL